jgi:UDP-N-acetylglucosamine enolpyruvyl transferase
LKGLEKLGAKIELESGYVIAEAENYRVIASILIFQALVRLGIFLWRLLANGTTQISNAAIEPEITAPRPYAR